MRENDYPRLRFFLRRAFDWVVKSGGYPGKESVNFLQKRVKIQSFDSWKGIAQMQNGKLYEQLIFFISESK